MAELNYCPVQHDHKAFLERASKRAGFQEEYETLAIEYAIVNQLLAARTKAGLTQETVAIRMGTTKSAVSRLESASKHTPSLATLKKLEQSCVYPCRGLYPYNFMYAKRKMNR